MIKFKLPKKFKTIYTQKLQKRLGIFILVIGAVAILYVGRSLFIAALVNGQPIFRLSVIGELEKSGGRSTLNNLVDKLLIFQEAKKGNFSVGQEIINSEIKRIEDVLQEQGLSLDEALIQQGQTKEGLIEQIKLQKLVEAMLSSKISIEDKDVSDYFAQNKDLYEKGTTIESVKDEIRQRLFQQKIVTEYQKWIEEIRNKANVFYFVNYQPL